MRNIQSTNSGLSVKKTGNIQVVEIQLTEIIHKNLQAFVSSDK